MHSKPFVDISSFSMVPIALNQGAVWTLANYRFIVFFASK
jgi:hypothetical protein